MSKLDLNEDALNQRAASALAQLIHFGLATVPPDSLPASWAAGYQAVRAQVGGGLYERQQAFQEAISGFPDRAHMELEVEDALDEIETRPEDQLRVRNVLHQLVLSGHVRRADGGHRGQKALYQLAEQDTHRHCEEHTQ